MRNRIIAIVLVVALIPCLLAFPASAAGATKDTIVNLMSEMDTYTFTSSGKVSSDGSLAFCQNVNDVTILWTPGDIVNSSSVYFTIFSSDVPTIDSKIDGNYYDCEYLGSNGSYHNFKSNAPGVFSSVILYVYFASSYTGVLSLFSAFGTRDDAYILNKVNLQNQALLYEADDDKLYRYIVEDLYSASLPVYTSHVTNYVTEPVDPLLEGVLYSHIKSEQIPFNYADSITILFQTSGSVKEVGFSLLSKDGKVMSQLGVDLTEFSYIQSLNVNFPDGTNMEWPRYVYSATVDLSGYDLSDLNLSFFCTVDPVYLDEYEGFTGYQFVLSNVILYPTIEDDPWYVRFGKWITGGFNSVISGLTSGFNSVVEAISSAFNPDGSSELSQAGEDLSQSAGDINSAGDVLGSVDQPDVNTGDLIGGLTNFDTGGLRILSCLTSNAQVTQMMIVVFTFCLAGYIFFGKKG